MVLGLLACGASLASVRMDGLGPNLVDLIDDPVTDLMRYPQLNVLTPGWLVGVEKGWSYYPYVRATGRWSVAAALKATRGDTMYVCSPSLAVAGQSGRYSFGLALTSVDIGNHDYRINSARVDGGAETQANSSRSNNSVSRCLRLNR